MPVFDIALPENLANELEKEFFWWEPVGSQPRTNAPHPRSSDGYCAV